MDLRTFLAAAVFGAFGVAGAGAQPAQDMLATVRARGQLDSAAWRRRAWG